MKEKNTDMKKVYDEYFKCGHCDSVYHISMLDKNEILCKDCNNVNPVPKEAQDKCKKQRKY